MKKLKNTLRVVIIGVSLLATIPVMAQSSDLAKTPTTERTTDHDDFGKWGLLGLIGLAGLFGLRKTDDQVHSEKRQSIRQ